MLVFSGSRERQKVQKRKEQSVLRTWKGTHNPWHGSWVISNWLQRSRGLYDLWSKGAHGADIDDM